MTDRADALPDGMLTRAEFEDRVMVDRRTVTAWISEGILSPGKERRGRYWIQTFTADDVRFGRALRSLLKARHGELTRAHAAGIVRGELMPPDEGHDPRDSPPLTYRSRDWLTAADLAILELYIQKHTPPPPPGRR